MLLSSRVGAAHSITSERAGDNAGCENAGHFRAWRHNSRVVSRDYDDVTLVVIAILAGTVAGFARGGGLARLITLRPVRNRLLLTGLGGYAVGVMLALLWQPALAFFASLAMLIWAFYAWINRSVQGAVLISAGLAANALVLLINGATPVSQEAAGRAGAAFPEAIEPQLNEQAGEDSNLAWLGKSIPIAFPPRPEVVSPGDLAIAAGFAVVVCMGMTGRRRKPPQAPADDEWSDADQWSDTEQMTEPEPLDTPATR